MTIRAILFDFGDTLADEATEVKDATDTTLRAELIPGAAALLHELSEWGVPLALVADGRPGTYRNVLQQHDVYDLFDAFAISEEVGVEKPDARMFEHALQALDIGPEGYGEVLMVGNNLARDVCGANRLGLISVWLDWAPRRAKTPANEEQIPRYTIKEPLQLLDVISRLRQSE